MVRPRGYNPARTASTVALYEPVYREFALGDRIQFTRQWKEQQITSGRQTGGPQKMTVIVVPNRALGTVEQLDSEGNITVKLDQGSKRVSWNLEQMGHLDHGYAMTSYSAQGSAADKVIVHVDTDAPGRQRLLNQQLLYVATSRGRLDVRLFVNDREDLDRYLTRDEQKATALAPDEVDTYRKLQTPTRQQAGIRR